MPFDSADPAAVQSAKIRRSVVSRIRRGSRGARELVFRWAQARLAPHVRQTLARRLPEVLAGDPTAIDDVIHEAVTRFYEAAGRGRVRKNSVKRFLMGLVPKVIVDWYRKRGSTSRHVRQQLRAGRRSSLGVNSDDPAEVAADAEVGEEQIFDVVEAAIATDVAARDRAAATLVWLHMKSADEAARELGCHPATVRRSLANARDVLRPRLARLLGMADAEEAR